jgi:outer membrane protein OmpA-like peptidoglycan-associated protein
MPALLAAPLRAKTRSVGIGDNPPAIDVLTEAQGKVLRWRFAEGEILELKKFSEQLIKTGKESQKRSVFHRVLLEARAPDPIEGFLLDGTFTSLVRDNETRGAFGESENYTASFHLKPAGQMDAGPSAYMPNIRSVPSFPSHRDPGLQNENSMEAGTTWEGPGVEIMRFDSLVAVPFNVRYEYRGIENVKSEGIEKRCHKFISNYELNFGGNESTGPRVFGYVTAVWFWDGEQGIPHYAQEEYNVIIVNKEALATEFKIKSRSYYRKFRARGLGEKLRLVQTLDSKLRQENPALNIRVTDNGVAISLPDLFFKTDSFKLSSDATEALEKIGAQLKALNIPHIRVRGHTDSVGDSGHNQTLSEKRAESVADFLINEIELKHDSVSFEGRGARDPVADNSTKDGRAKNRRVEIVILDK